MADVIDKLKNKVYKTKIKQEYDVKTGYFYYVELDKELIEELKWYEDLKLDVTVKLGNHRNAVVIEKS